MTKKKGAKSRAVAGQAGKGVRKTGHRGTATSPTRKRPAIPAAVARRTAARETPQPAQQAPESEAHEHTRPETAFPVVGIGASAGGLEALELFLKNVPTDCGMAFVIVQHLDPTHKGNMVELLQRATKMPVLEVVDRLRIEPDRVYIIPPGQDMSILHGALHLMPQALPRGLNLPIDFFFRSLASDQHERSIAVVLSGMGSDGTLGVRAIKEEAGAAFVQALTSAKFEGMPRSVIDAGLADVVAPVEELPARIVAYREHAPYISRRHEDVPDAKAQNSLEKVFILLRAQTGNDFSLYKKSTIQRRIERRMGLHQVDKLSTYVRFLRENPREIDLLFRELLIGVTNFFRDPAAWDFLRNEVLPALLLARPNGSALRAWVPGCSTGEEAYSLAIVFKEALLALNAPKNLTLQVFATDLDRDAIDKARQGLYPPNIAADVSAERLRRFFVQEERGFRVNKDIREMVVFAPQNIIMDPPFTRLDVLSCRNLLIYLAPELQKKIIPLFHYALNPGGVLFLGSAETVGTFSALFTPADGKTRIYRRVDAGGAVGALDFPVTVTGKVRAAMGEQAEQPMAAFSPAALNLQTLADHVLVQRLAPSAVLTSDRGDILYINGRTGKYLEPAAGRANLNVFAMARDGLRVELSNAFAAALRKDGPVVTKGIRVGTNGGTELVDVTVQRLTEPKELRGTVLVIMADAAEERRGRPRAPVPRGSTSGRMEKLERALQRAHEEIQTVREEMQTSQEELKSTNEELQSTNEELQSTNEELTTSKEEMQSMNEELQTVNHELQSKVDELSRSNNDMKNLLNSTDIATLFLDSRLLVRRFTTPTASIIKLIPSDAGRPITDITSDIDYPELADDAREVLRTLMFKERLVSATNERWFSVRILPYRTIENVIDGVVITFTDASAAKAIEASLRSQANELRQMAESLPSLVWGCRMDGACDYVSPQWTDYTGIPAPELMGHGWLHAVHPDDRERVREVWREAVKSGAPLSLEFRMRAKKSGSYRWFRSRATPIRDAQGKLSRWYGTHVDVDDLKQAVDQRKEAIGSFIRIFEHTIEPLFALTERDAVSYVNIAAEKLLALPRAEIVGRRFFELFPELNNETFREQQRVARRERASRYETAIARGKDRQAFTLRIHETTEGTAVSFERKDIAPGGNDGIEKASH